MITIEKLNKLRAFAERGDGPEEKNAERLLKRLLKQYDIRGFKYTPYTTKTSNDESEKRNNWKTNQEAEHEYSISYTSLMRDVVFALGMKLNVAIVCPTRASKLYARCTQAKWVKFSAALKSTKKRWRSAVAAANKATIDAIDNRF